MGGGVRMEGVLGQLKRFAMSKGYGLARKKGVACPDCGQAVVLPPEMPEGGLKARFSCGKCDWEGNLIETMEFGRIPDSPLQEKPVGSRVSKKGDRWVIPGTGRLNGEWLFSLVWLGFITVAAVVLLFLTDESPVWWGLLFLLPFYAVGFWMLHLAFWMTFGETEVKIIRSEVRVTKRLFAMLREKRIPVGTLEGVRLVPSDDESGSGSELVFKRRNQKDLKVALGVSVDEKRWLLGEWREKLGLKEEREIRSGVGRNFEKKAIQGKGVELEPGENGNFFLTVRNRVAPWAIGAGIFTLVIGGVLVTSGDWGDDGGDEVPRFFRILEWVFSVVGVVFGTIPLVVGAGALIWGARKLGEVRKYAFYRDRIEFATVRRGGRMIRSGSLPRDSVKDVVMTRVGHSNGDARYKVALRASENMSLIQFYPREVAEELEGWVRQWIEGAREGGYDGEGFPERAGGAFTENS